MECLNCNSSWNDDIGANLTNCPICKHNLIQNCNIIDNNSPLSILKNIVKQFDSEIYNDNTRFKSILADYLTSNKRLLKILKLIIDNNGARDIYKHSTLEDNKFNLKIRAVLFRISEDTFIPQDTLSDGIILLCQGLGKDFKYNNNQQASQVTSNATIQTPTPVSIPVVTQTPLATPSPIPVVTQTSVPIITPVSINNNITFSPLDDFKIENNILKKYLGNESCINIPNSVTEIGDEAFLGYITLTSITIPDSVTSIGYSVFLGCSSLTSVTIPDSVTSIGYSAFLGCSVLNNIKIPNSVTEIGTGAFPPHTKITRY